MWKKFVNGKGTAFKSPVSPTSPTTTSSSSIGTPFAVALQKRRSRSPTTQESSSGVGNNGSSVVPSSRSSWIPTPSGDHPIDFITLCEATEVYLDDDTLSRVSCSDLLEGGNKGRTSLDAGTSASSSSTAVPSLMVPWAYPFTPYVMNTLLRGRHQFGPSASMKWATAYPSLEMLYQRVPWLSSMIAPPPTADQQLQEALLRDTIGEAGNEEVGATTSTTTAGEASGLDEALLVTTPPEPLEVVIRKLHSTQPEVWLRFFTMWLKQWEYKLNGAEETKGAGGGEASSSSSVHRDEVVTFLIQGKKVFERGFRMHPSWDAGTAGVDASHSALVECVAVWYNQVRIIIFATSGQDKNGATGRSHASVGKLFYYWKSRGTLVGDAFLSKIRMHYLRQYKVLQYCTLLKSCIEREMELYKEAKATNTNGNGGSHNSNSIQLAEGVSQSTIFKDELLSYFVVLPGKRECQGIDPLTRWKLTCEYLTLVYPLMTNRRPAIQYALTNGFYLGSGKGLTKADCLLSIGEIVSAAKGMEESGIGSSSTRLSSRIGEFVSVAAAIGLSTLKTMKFNPEHSASTLYMLSLASSLLQLASCEEDGSSSRWCTADGLRQLLSRLYQTRPKNMEGSGDEVLLVHPMSVKEIVPTAISTSGASQEVITFIEKVLLHCVRHLCEAVEYGKHRVRTLKQFLEWGVGIMEKQLMMNTTIVTNDSHHCSFLSPLHSPTVWSGFLESLGAVDALLLADLPIDATSGKLNASSAMGLMWWRCGCGQENPVCSTACHQCSWNPSGDAAAPNTNGGAHNSFVPQYQCGSCQHVNLLASNGKDTSGGACQKRCSKCFTPHPRQHNLRSLDLWSCNKCSIVNSSSTITASSPSHCCRNCSEVNPEHSVECSNCTKARPVGALFCPYCGTREAPSSSWAVKKSIVDHPAVVQVASHKPLLLWRCGTCTGINVMRDTPTENILCRHCLHTNTSINLQRQQEKGQQPPAMPLIYFNAETCPVFHYFTWQCGCGADNSPLRRTCWSCSGSKPMNDQKGISKSAGPKTLYQCPSCSKENTGHLKLRSINDSSLLSSLFQPSVPVCQHCTAIHPREATILQPRLIQCPGCSHLVAPPATASSPSQTESEATLEGRQESGVVPCPHCQFDLSQCGVTPKYVDLPWTCHGCGTKNSYAHQHHHAQGNSDKEAHNRIKGSSGGETLLQVDSKGDQQHRRTATSSSSSYGLVDVCSQCQLDRINVMLFDEYREWSCSSPACLAADDEEPTSSSNSTLLNRGFSCKSCHHLHPAVPVREVSVWCCSGGKGSSHEKQAIPSWQSKCGTCHNSSPLLNSDSSSNHPIKKAGEVHQYKPWQCRRCFHHNSPLSLSTHCHKCKASKPRIPCQICHEYHESLECPEGAMERRYTVLERAILAACSMPSSSSNTVEQNQDEKRQLLGKAMENPRSAQHHGTSRGQQLPPPPPPPISSFSAAVMDDAELLSYVQEHFSWQPTEEDIKVHDLIHTTPLLIDV